MIVRIPENTQMYGEAAEASAAIARQYAANVRMMQDLAHRIRTLNPRMIFTCARGSSDHAATFAKYVFETRLRIPTLSQAPSLSSIYGATLLHMSGQVFITFSQSGKSPDLILSATAARAAGALVIGFINAGDTPLGAVCDVVVPLHAGEERSVAATKSYIATLAAIAHLAAEWGSDDALQTALNGLPDVLTAAWTADWSAGVAMFSGAASMFVLGRGLTYGVAQECALKFKETSGIHAEAYSVAEVLHGPMALVKPGFPLLVLPPADAAAAGVADVITRFADCGAHIACAGKYPGSIPLPVATDLHPAIAPIAMAQSFYRMVNAVSVARGYNPDHPPMLQKITATL